MTTKEKPYSVTMLEACEILSKSKKTVGRYVRKGLLRPKQIKSRQGTPEYRFDMEELKAFRDGQERQEITNTTERTVDIIYGNSFDLKEVVPDSADLEETGKAVIEDTPDNQDESAKTDKPIDKIDKINETGQDNTEKTDKQRQESREGFDGILSVLQATIETLNKQLEVKDRHIEKLTEKMGSLLERQKEWNYMLKAFQDKFPMLEAPKTRRGRKPKIHTAEPLDIDIEEIQAEAETEDQEQKEKSKPNKKKEDRAEAEELEKQEKEAEEPEEKPKKKGFWKKLFTPYNLP